MDFGNKLRSLRIDKGLNQTQLAERLGVTNSIISAYETQMRMPSLDLLVKIALEFSVSIDWLLGMERISSLDIAGLTNEQVLMISNMTNEFRRLNRK
ncbi:MAG: helix-turn-helix domain-containing protein [Oscillospiraceae bacterium]|nr:helix-turn-helix domain-containing protein [Oscillospiraceae bacterium]